jgi:Arc/MetJ-type ribon-helix-helix transcriptional regulator
MPLSASIGAIATVVGESKDGIVGAWSVLRLADSGIVSLVARLFWQGRARQYTEVVREALRLLEKRDQAGSASAPTCRQVLIRWSGAKVEPMTGRLAGNVPRESRRAVARLPPGIVDAVSAVSSLAEPDVDSGRRSARSVPLLATLRI